MSKKTLCRVGTLLLITTFLINTFYIFYDHSGYINFLKSYVSPDGQISKPETIITRIQILFIWAICGWLVLTSKSVINRFSNLHKFHQTSLTIVLLMFVVSPLAETKYGFLSVEDGLLETITTIFALLSSIILLFSIRKHKGKIDISVKIILSFMFLFFGMEEISWGQRIFEWETPQSLSDLNFQNETNIHNILNPYFSMFYPFFNLLMCLFLIISMKLKTKTASFLKSETYLYLLPSHEFQIYIIVFLSLCLQSIVSGGELTEEVFSVFILTYAVNQLFMLKIPNKRVGIDRQTSGLSVNTPDDSAF